MTMADISPFGGIFQYIDPCISGPCYGAFLQSPVLGLCSEALFRRLFPGPSPGAFFLSFVPEKCSKALFLDLAQWP